MRAPGSCRAARRAWRAARRLRPVTRAGTPSQGRVRTQRRLCSDVTWGYISDGLASGRRLLAIGDSRAASFWSRTRFRFERAHGGLARILFGITSWGRGGDRGDGAGKTSGADAARLSTARASRWPGGQPRQAAACSPRAGGERREPAGGRRADRRAPASAGSRGRRRRSCWPSTRPSARPASTSWLLTNRRRRLGTGVLLGSRSCSRIERQPRCPSGWWGYTRPMTPTRWTLHLHDPRGGSERASSPSAARGRHSETRRPGWSTCCSPTPLRAASAGDRIGEDTIATGEDHRISVGLHGAAAGARVRRGATRASSAVLRAPRRACTSGSDRASHRRRTRPM